MSKDQIKQVAIQVGRKVFEAIYNYSARVCRDEASFRRWRRRATIVALGFAMFMSMIGEGHAMSVWCANCSTSFSQKLQQAYEYITQTAVVQNLAQVKQVYDTTVKELREEVEQTIHQAMLVKQTYDDLQYTVKNSVKMGADMVNRVKGAYTDLVKVADGMYTTKAGSLAVDDMFNRITDGATAIKRAASITDSLDAMEDSWQNWKKRNEAVVQDVFTVTYDQLHSMAQNSDEVNNLIDSLVKDADDAQLQKAVQNGVAMSGLAVNELRDMRFLLNTQAQMQAQEHFDDMKAHNNNMEMIDKLWGIDDFKASNRALNGN